MSDIRYRGGGIQHDSYGASWSWYPGYASHTPAKRVYTHLFGVIRCRSDDEAIRILCEWVDAMLDAASRREAFIKERQDDLKAREEALQAVERTL